MVMHSKHFIVPRYCSVNDVKEGIKKALKKFGCTSATVSRIFMHKEKCITTEKYEETYKTFENIKLRSVGEDLETFIDKIKNGEIDKNTIAEHGMFVSFLLCLLDKEERKKLEQKDYDFMETFYEAWIGREADVPEAEWKASESNMKFAKSECFRETYFIDA